jgi:hypothetical protein
MIREILYVFNLFLKGIVSTRKSLDREQQAEYTLEITARNGSSSSKALLVITIDDVNDHDPLFLREKYQVYTGSIYDMMMLVASSLVILEFTRKCLWFF